MAEWSKMACVTISKLMTQDEALKILKTGVNVFLTGEPGSGKSHTIRTYVSYLRSCGVEPAITASTGIAATHIGGMTIHSWSGIGIAKTLSKNELIDIAGKDRVARRMRNTQVLIIDEISMLSAGTLDLVDRVCKKIRNSEQPFGGLQIVFVGDFFQLPPVSRFGEGEQAFSFQSSAWIGANPTICYLSEQHRQEDSAFLEILSALRSDALTEEHIRRLQTRKVDPIELPDVTKLYSHNTDVDRINTARLKLLPGAARSYDMDHKGAKPLVEQLQRGCLSPETLTLKIGAQVMFTRNNFEAGFVNGTTGEVAGFSPDSKLPIIHLRTGREIEVEQGTWAIEAEGKQIASITQLPLRLAWAMTIHKSQGMSLDAAYVDLSGAFAFGQGYVALSRVRTLDGLYLGGLNHRALQIDATVLEQDGQFHDSSFKSQQKLAKMEDEYLQKQHEIFIFTCGGDMSFVSSPPERSTKRFKNARPKKDKIKKEKRWEQTLKLISDGKSIVEAAKERGLTIGTIITHLEDVKKLGQIVTSDLAHIISNKDCRVIHDAFRSSGNDFLTPTHEYLEGKYDYETIRLARILFS